MASRHEDFLAAGGRIFGIVVDSPAQNSALIQKLSLPFPILSDPDRGEAISPMGYSNATDPRNIALPGTVIIGTDGADAFRWESRDFADRIPEDDVIAALERIGGPATSQEPPTLGPAEPGPKALPFEQMGPYFRGARFAAQALGLRHKDAYPDIKDDSKAYIAEMDRYLAAYNALKESRANKT